MCSLLRLSCLPLLLLLPCLTTAPLAAPITRCSNLLCLVFFHSYPCGFCCPCCRTRPQMRAEQVNLQMMANKACARWVEAHQEAAKSAAALQQQPPTTSLSSLVTAASSLAAAGQQTQGGQKGSSSSSGAPPTAAVVAVAAAVPKGPPGWGPPTVLDPKVLRAGGVDMEMYTQVAGGLAAEGQVALMMIYMGEEQVGGC